MKKNMVYFVLYIVLISELLMVIVERDDLLEQEEAIRDQMLTTISDSYKKPVMLLIPERFSDYNIKNKEPKKVVMTPIGLVSEAEKQNVEYFVEVTKKNNRIPPGWPKGGVSNTTKTDKYFIVRNKDGSAVFNAKITIPGVYKFSAYFKAKRELPTYLPDFLQEELKEMIGEHLVATSPKVEFTINAKRIGGVKKKEVEIDW